MKRKSYIISGLFILFVFVVGFGVNHQFNKPTNLGADGREFELGGPAAAALSNTGKLNNLLTPPRFTAAKEAISKYILDKYPYSKTATIETTKLNADGSISLTILTDDKSTFGAQIQNLPDVLMFEVSTTNYKKTYTEDDINKAYGGLED